MEKSAAESEIVEQREESALLGAGDESVEHFVNKEVSVEKG